MPRKDAKFCTSMPVNCGPAPEGPRTVVCFGLPRGGTSMLAGAVLGLGVPMGDGLKSNIEDPDFNVVTHEGSLPDFVHDVRSTIKARNEAHDIWGWKCPFAPRYLAQVINDLRAPRLVYVFRDPVPKALRAKVEANDALDFITQRLKAQVRNTALIAELGVPSLLVSYEKAIAHPGAFLEELALFVGLPMPGHVDEIVEFIAPGHYKDPAALVAHLSPPGAPNG